VIDLHCHVLPGIDDGPETIEGSLALARAASAGGTRTLVATPHVNLRYPNDAATIARLVGELNERLAAERIAIEVRPGAEIALTSAINMAPARLAELGLAQAAGLEPHSWEDQFWLGVARAAAGVDPRAAVARAIALDPLEPGLRNAARRLASSSRCSRPPS